MLHFGSTDRLKEFGTLSQSYTASGQIGPIFHILTLHNKQADAILTIRKTLCYLLSHFLRTAHLNNYNFLLPSLFQLCHDN